MNPFIGIGPTLTRRRGGGEGGFSLSPELRAKFLFLWTGTYVGDNLKNDVGSDNIIVLGKDWTTEYIPETGGGMFFLPYSQAYADADFDGFWADIVYTGDLITSLTTRTFVKYKNSSPYDIEVIGILKADAVLTSDERNEVTQKFQLWNQYWGVDIDPYGVNKGNRTAYNDSYSISFSDDVNANYSTLSGLTLTDLEGGSAANILLPVTSFNGAEYAYYQDNGALNPSATTITIAAWIGPPGSSYGSRYWLGKMVQGLTTNGSYGIYNNGTTSVIAFMYTSAGLFSVTSTGDFYGRPFTFYLMEIDISAKTLKFFINNAQVGSTVTWTGTFASLGNQYEFMIGAGHNTDGSGVFVPVYGHYADTYVYTRVLTPEEKTTLYNRGVVSGAYAHWDCVLRKDNELLDLSGNGRHATGSGLTRTTRTRWNVAGSRQGHALGYTRYWGFPWVADYAYQDNGTPLTGFTPGDVYKLDGNYPASGTYYNGYDCKIALNNAIWDRSNTTIYNRNARLTNNNHYYDSTNVRHWHITELYPNNIFNYCNAAYQGRNFTRFKNGQLQHIIEYNTNKNVSDYSTVMTNLKQKRIYLDYYWEPKHILASFGNKVLATNDTDTLYLSLDGGQTWPITKAKGSVGVLGFGIIYPNGNINFFDHRKAYLSTDNLTTFSETTVLNRDGSAFTPHVSSENYFRPLAPSYALLNGVTYMPLFGTYSTGYPPRAWYSTDNGVTIKSAYDFGGTGQVSARHVHVFIYNPYNSKYYLCTGDFANESHLIEGTYNSGTDVWSWTTIGTGDQNTIWQIIGLSFNRDLMYIGHENFNGNDSINTVKATDVATTSKWIRSTNENSRSMLKIGTFRRRDMLYWPSYGQDYYNIVVSKFDLNGSVEVELDRTGYPGTTNGIYGSLIHTLKNGYAPMLIYNGTEAFNSWQLNATLMIKAVER